MEASATQGTQLLLPTRRKNPSTPPIEQGRKGEQKYHSRYHPAEENNDTSCFKNSPLRRKETLQPTILQGEGGTVQRRLHPRRNEKFYFPPHRPSKSRKGPLIIQGSLPSRTNLTQKKTYLRGFRILREGKGGKVKSLGRGGRGRRTGLFKSEVFLKENGVFYLGPAARKKAPAKILLKGKRGK